MGKEIEKKFLISGKIPFDMGQPTLIKQGYVFAEKGLHLRIRLIDHNAIIGLKYTEGAIRDEYEYEIPFEEGFEIYNKCELKVEKIRFYARYKNLSYDIDMFPNHVKYVEVEFNSIEESNAFEKPDWIGEEITGKSEYSNITFAKENLTFN